KSRKTDILKIIFQFVSHFAPFFSLYTFRRGKSSILQVDKRGGCAVPTSLFDKNYELDMAIFDSYSRTVLKNLSSNEKKAMNCHQEHEVNGTEIMQYISDTYGHEDIYPSEFVITDERGHRCVVTLAWLYRAILLLPEKQKEVLILEFWYGLLRKEVANTLGVSERTINNWKRKAFNSIRDYYERKEK
ncbi:MAG: RNA polymerase sigma factor, partial [Clostridia bacterium]